MGLKTLKCVIELKGPADSGAIIGTDAVIWPIALIEVWISAALTDARTYSYYI